MTNRNNRYPSLNQRIPSKEKELKYYAVRDDGTRFELGKTEEETRINSQKRNTQTNPTSAKPLKEYRYFEKDEENMIDKYIPDDFASNARHLMKLPVYSLESKRIKDKVIEHHFVENGIKYHLRVSSNEKLGVADHRDGDIVRYAISRIMYNYQIHGKLIETIEFTQYQLLKEINKHTTKQNYEWLKDAIFRLTSTHYVTNLWVRDPSDTFAGNMVNIRFDSNQILEKRKIQFSFNKDVLQFLMNGGILSIDKEILKESSNLRKKLLEIIQCHIGKSNFWQIGVKKLIDRCGYKGSVKAFNKNLKRLDLPYEVEKKTNQQREQILGFSKTKNSQQDSQTACLE